MVFPLPRVTTKQPCGPTCNNTRGGKKRGREHHTISSGIIFVQIYQLQIQLYFHVYIILNEDATIYTYVVTQLTHNPTETHGWAEIRRIEVKRAISITWEECRQYQFRVFDRARTRGCMDEKSYGFHFQQHLSGHVRTATLRPSPSIQINIHESEQDFLSWVNVQ